MKKCGLEAPVEVESVPRSQKGLGGRKCACVEEVVGDWQKSS